MISGLTYLLIIIGALGLFMYGMRTSSEALQKVAGSRMREILNTLTSNRVRGLFTGLFTTMIIQTSTATTVMIVGFVNAGLVSLRQAISLIAGANIGTTIKAWLFAYSAQKLNIEYAGLIGVAFAFPLLFMRRTAARSVAEFLVGFGLMLIGLGFIRSASEDLEHSEWFIAFIGSLSGLGFLSVLLALLTGMLLTMVVQSSSLMLAFTLVLSEQGIIPFDMAVAMVLGENIGTTFTANLAAIVANRNAKRAALAHTLFNLCGVLLALPFFPYLVEALNYGTAALFDAGSPNDTTEARPFALALLHSGFNVGTALLVIPLAAYFEKLITWLIPYTQNERSDFRLQVMSQGFIRTPELMRVEANKGIEKLTRLHKEMFDCCEKLLTLTEPQEFAAQLKKTEALKNQSDHITLLVREYYGRIAGMDISTESSVEVRRLTETVQDMDDLSHVFFEIGKVMEQKFREKIWFSPGQRNHIRSFFPLLRQGLENMGEKFSQGHTKSDKTDPIDIAAMIKRLKQTGMPGQEHEGQELPARSAMVYSTLLNYYEEAGEFITAVLHRR